MISLHTHTIFSDGDLLPSELARRAQVNGYNYLGITDHVDASNIESVFLGLSKACRDINKYYKIKAIPGVEITHVALESIPVLTKEARRMGAKLVVVHGETIVEPVKKGTNLTAINSGVDILAHPGMITKEEALLAKKKGVFLEITTRRGHSLTNGHVVRLALETGAKLILNTDAHYPEDIIDLDFAVNTLTGAGLTNAQAKKIISNAKKFAKELLNG